MTPQDKQPYSISSFVNYNNVVATLVGDLKKLRFFSLKLNLNKSVELIDEVLKRVEANSFTVAIVGEFKRGKSTFINALLGREILPTDVLPCSATLNRVRYNITPIVQIIFKDGRIEQIPIDKLVDYVTKLTPESEETAALIEEAIVEYPIPYCKNNVEIIDTPGLNDDVNMTQVTLSVLPQVDAAILVIMAQAPFSQYEQDFLENKLMTNDLGRVIFVVTGIDRLPRPEDADRVINSIKTRIQKYVFQRAEEQFGKDSPEYEVYLKKIGTPKIFGISAYQALEAERTNDNLLKQQSRFPQFTQALEKFLTEDRGAILLQVPVNRAITSSVEILKTLTIQENALEMKKEDFQQAFDASVAELDSIRKKQTEQMKLIDRATEEVKYRVRPLIYNLEIELKQAATEAVDSVNIQPAELKNQKKLSEKLSQTAANALQNAARKLSEKMQLEIERGLTREVERLEDFIVSVDQSLNKIEMEFGNIDASSVVRGGATGQAAAAGLAVFLGLGGIYTGYRQAGVKGALVGAAGSFGSLVGVGALVALIGLPVTWPVVIGSLVISTISGGFLAGKVFAGDRIENFKSDFKSKILEQISKELKEQHLEQKINDQISDTFATLKQKIHQEVESLLDNTQQTLTDLRSKREKDIVLTETERQQLAQIRTETEQILGNAERLSSQLVQIMSV